MTDGHSLVPGDRTREGHHTGGDGPYGGAGVDRDIDAPVTAVGALGRKPTNDRAVGG